MSYESYVERLARQLGVAGVDPRWSAVPVGEGFEMQYDGLPVVRFDSRAEAQAFLIGKALKV